MKIFATIAAVLDSILENVITYYVVLGMVFLLSISPLVLMLLTSFKTPAEAALWPPTVFPHKITLENFRAVIFESKVPLAVRNSLIIALCTVVIVVIVSTFTAYGLSKYKFRGSKFLGYTLLATRIIPPISLLVSFFAIFSRLGLINTKLGLIIINVYLNYPITTWLLMNAFDNFPSELLDAAKVDGASRTQILFRVVLPLILPAISSGAIITFLFTWNEFLYALTFSQTAASMPLTVGIFEFVGDEAIEWTKLSAVGVFASLPSILFFIFAQRYIVQGLTAGAIKGAA